MLKNAIVFVVIPVLLFYSCKDSEQADSEAVGGKKMEIKITSPAFEEGGLIPPKYTCDGADISPPLQWDAVPDGTKSIALISDDPDAPVGTWEPGYTGSYSACRPIQKNCRRTSRLMRLCPMEPNKGLPTLAESAMAAPAHQAAHTDISLRFTHSRRNLIWPPGLTKLSCSRRWKDISSVRDN